MFPRWFYSAWHFATRFFPVGRNAPLPRAAASMIVTGPHYSASIDTGPRYRASVSVAPARTGYAQNWP